MVTVTDCILEIVDMVSKSNTLMTKSCLPIRMLMIMQLTVLMALTMVITVTMVRID